LSVLVVLAGAVYWVESPMGFKSPASSNKTDGNSSALAIVKPETLDLAVEPGTTPKGVAQAIADAGTDVSPLLLRVWFRLSGQDRAIKAGSYEITADMSPRRLDFQAIQASFGQGRKLESYHSEPVRCRHHGATGSS
jgi:cell division protein YceG involved in septum cleavage